MPSITRIQETSALLFAWSVFALVEGTIRMVANSKPSVDTDYFTSNGGTQVPVIALLIGGAAEVCFGIAGCYVAMYSLLLNKNNTLVTKAFLVIQAVFGWYVFLTFVIAAPILSAQNATGNELFSQAEERSLIILGNMLGSICFCWALQGGQFIMGMRLLAAQTDQEETKEKNALRAKVWAGNVLAASFSTLFVGSMLDSKGFTSDTAPIGLPPHVVWYPVISIVSGVFMLAYGVVSWMAATRESMNQKMPMMWVLCTTAMMVNFSWTFGIVPGLAPPIPGAAQHIGLIFSVTLLPLIHSHRAHFAVPKCSVDDDEATKVDLLIKAESNDSTQSKNASSVSQVSNEIP